MAWGTSTLGKLLLDSGSGTWGKEAKAGETAYPVLRSTNMQDGGLVFADYAYRSVGAKAAAKYALASGDILVTTSSGSTKLIGKHALFEPPDSQTYLYSNFTLRMKPDQNKVIPAFLYHYLHSGDARNALARITSTTSGLRNLNVPQYLEQTVPLPPMEEQRRIADLLDEADRLQRLRKEANEKARRILPALFVDMFGDPETNPMGWEVRPLKNVLVDASSGTWGDEPTSGVGGIPVLRSTNIQNGLLVLGDVARRVVGERAAAKSTLEWGDIIVTTSSGSKHHIGKNAFFGLDEDSGTHLYSNFTLRLRPDARRTACRYIHAHLNTGAAKRYLVKIQSTTSGLRNLDKTGYLEQPIMLPTLAQQERFALLAEQAVSLSETMATEAERMAIATETLRSRLFAEASQEAGVA